MENEIFDLPEELRLKLFSGIEIYLMEEESIFPMGFFPKKDDGQLYCSGLPLHFSSTDSRRYYITLYEWEEKRRSYREHELCFEHRVKCSHYINNENQGTYINGIGERFVKSIDYRELIEPLILKALRILSTEVIL